LVEEVADLAEDGAPLGEVCQPGVFGLERAVEDLAAVVVVWSAFLSAGLFAVGGVEEAGEFGEVALPGGAVGLAVGSGGAGELLGLLGELALGGGEDRASTSSGRRVTSPGWTLASRMKVRRQARMGGHLHVGMDLS